MNTQTCLSQDIVEINKSKEYTLISTALLENVLTDVRLNAQTSKLWQILFNKTRYNPNLEIKISYSYLAKTLNKSSRTIARYIGSLQNAGYLIVQHNFDKKGGQRPNTLSVRVPITFIEQVKKKKDRVNKKPLITNETLVASTKHKQESSDYNEENPVNDYLTQSVSDKTPVLCETPCHADETEKTPVPIQEKISDKIELEETPPQSYAADQDKNVMGGDDKTVIQKDINIKDLNNNNTVVPLSQEKQRMIEIKNEIKRFEEQLDEGNKKIITIKNHTLLYDQLRKNLEIEAALQLMRNNLERIQKIIDKAAEQDEISHHLNNPRFILEKKGDRALPIFTFKRLVKSLKSYGYDEKMLPVLINEIVFEVRFGSLMKCNKTKAPLSMENAINICLKLVREKRWSTPVLFKTLL